MTPYSAHDIARLLIPTGGSESAYIKWQHGRRRDFAVGAVACALIRVAARLHRSAALGQSAAFGAEQIEAEIGSLGLSEPHTKSVIHLLSREPGDGFSCAWAAPEEPEHCYWPGFVLPEKEEADEGASKLFVCKYCGMPSYLEPIDQTPPSDYCHESDHGYPI